MITKTILSSILLNLTLIAQCEDADERIKLIFGISDAHVKNIYVKREVKIGKNFSFKDFESEKDDALIKTVVCGKCVRENNKYHVVAYRVTIKGNKIVRNDWFDQILEMENDENRVPIAGVSMGSATLFDVRLKDYIVK
jgi:hypothetical protein